MRKPRVAFAAVAGTAILTLVSGGVASASPAPAPVDCPTAVQGLVRVQLAENHDAKTVNRLTAERNQAKAELDAATLVDTTEDADSPADTEDGLVADKLSQLKKVQAGLANLKAGQADLATANAMPDDVGSSTAKAVATAAANEKINAAQGALAALPSLTDAQSQFLAATTADAQEDGNGVAENPQDSADSKLAAAKDKLAKAQKRLDGALADKARDDRGLLTVNIALQACQGTPGVPAVPVVPAPIAPVTVPTDSAPSPVVIIDGQAPAPQIVETHLPVTH